MDSYGLYLTRFAFGMGETSESLLALSQIYRRRLIMTCLAWAKMAKMLSVDNEKTIVIFRRRKDSKTVIALFPAIAFGIGQCLSYMHVGQHGVADYQEIISQTGPCLGGQYDGLDKELESLGYWLQIRKHK